MERLKGVGGVRGRRKWRRSRGFTEGMIKMTVGEGVG
jgi:hypothetical protein